MGQEKIETETGAMNVIDGFATVEIPSPEKRSPDENRARKHLRILKGKRSGRERRAFSITGIGLAMIEQVTREEEGIAEGQRMDSLVRECCRGFLNSGGLHWKWNMHRKQGASSS